MAEYLLQARKLPKTSKFCTILPKSANFLLNLLLITNRTMYDETKTALTGPVGGVSTSIYQRAALLRCTYLLFE